MWVLVSRPLCLVSTGVDRCWYVSRYHAAYDANRFSFLEDRGLTIPQLFPYFQGVKIPSCLPLWVGGSNPQAFQSSFAKRSCEVSLLIVSQPRKGAGVDWGEKERIPGIADSLFVILPALFFLQPNSAYGSHG